MNGSTPHALLCAFVGSGQHGLQFRPDFIRAEKSRGDEFVDVQLLALFSS